MGVKLGRVNSTGFCFYNVDELEIPCTYFANTCAALGQHYCCGFAPDIASEQTG